MFYIPSPPKPPLEGEGIFPLPQGELSHFNSLSLRKEDLHFNSLSLRERIKVRVG
jgi:hypothetical protein